MTRLFNVLATSLAIATGLVALFGLLLGGALAPLTSALLQIVVIAAAVTLVMGVLNLVGVHGGRVVRRGRGWVYSLALLIALFAVIFLRLTDQNDANAVLLQAGQASVEAALGGLVLFALMFGVYRLMRRRVTGAGMLFTVVVIVVLVGALPLETTSPVVAVRNWLVAVPGSAGTRGLLIGMALATVVTGMRVLIGQDRSMRE